MGIGTPKEDGVLRSNWETVKLGLLGKIQEETGQDDGADVRSVELLQDEERNGKKLRRSNTRSSIPIRVKKKEKEPQRSQSLLKHSMIPVRKKKVGYSHSFCAGLLTLDLKWPTITCAPNSMLG